MDGKFDIREDEEQSIKFNEIVELLLAGGYFRARIKGLSPFDKVVGGMVWAITTSSYDVDVDLLFSENLSIGQKIALTEKIVKVLPKMKCPYRIEPHQIQGLDFIHIYPVIQWLVKKAIETRELMGDFNRVFSASQFDKQFTLPQDVEQESILVSAKKSVLNLKQSYGARRKYRQNDVSRLTDEPSRVRATLLEYGWFISGGDVSALKQEGDQRSSKADEEDDAVTKEEQQRMKALLSGMEQTTFISRIAASTVGSIVGLQSDEIQHMAKEYAEKASEIENMSKSETSSSLHQKLISTLQKQIKQQQQKLFEIENEYKQLCETNETCQKRLSEAESINSVLDSKLAELEEIAKTAGEGVLQKLRSLVALNENLKQQEVDFKNHCKDELNRFQDEINRLKESNGLRNKSEIDAIENELETEQTKLNRIRILLAKRNREITTLRRKIDEVPSSAELSQYQKRFIELYNQIAAKHKETKLFYMLYNTLDDTKLYLEKEVSLLNSIYDSYQQVMQSSGSKDELLKQLQLVLDGIKQTKQRVDKRKQENRMKKDELNDKYLELVEKERLYYKQVKEFTEECDKNESLQARLKEITQ